MKILLLVYFFFFVLWFVGSAVAVYHNFEFYDSGNRMKAGLYGYVWYCVLLLIITFYFFTTINWSEPLNI